MQFKVEFDCDNASFGESKAERQEEIASLLRNVAAKVSCGFTSGIVRDSNGNNVGQFVMSGEEDGQTLQA